MNLRTTIIVFAVVFALGIFTIVILPFVLGGRPPAARPEPAPGGATEEIDQGVFRSDDGGRAWQAKSWVEGSPASIAEFRVNRLVPDPIDPATLYLLTDGNGLWVSRSRGELWAAVVDAAGVLDPQSNVLSLAVNPDRPQEWYAAAFQKSRGRVFRTADGGKTFGEIYATPVERFGVFDVHYDRARGAVLIATGQGGLLESRDQGRSWRVIRWFADGLVRLLVSPADPSVWYAATSRGNLFRTLDRGAGWVDITGSLAEFPSARRDQRWTVDRDGTLYVGSRHGLLRSRDNGTTFTAPPLIIPPDALPVRALAVDPRSPHRIVAAAASQIYASADDGASWAILSPPSARRITDLILDAAQPGTIYAVVQP